ncbi:MAG: DUF6088 family protein [Collimonas sp.]
MSDPIENVGRWIDALPEGALITSADLTHLVSRGRASRVLARLARHGQLMRAARGVYIAVTSSRFGPAPPPIEKVIHLLERKTGQVIVRHGAAAANALGLTTQVPIQQIYLTDGPTRTLTIGKQVIQIRHASKWMLARGDSLAGDIVRALVWLGPERVAESIATLAGRISGEVWQAILDADDRVPAWILAAIQKGAPEINVSSISSVNINK